MTPTTPPSALCSSWEARGRRAEAAGFSLPEGPYDTVAGWFVVQIGRLAEVGDVVEAPGSRATFEVTDYIQPTTIRMTE